MSLLFIRLSSSSKLSSPYFFHSLFFETFSRRNTSHNHSHNFPATTVPFSIKTNLPSSSSSDINATSSFMLTTTRDRVFESLLEPIRMPSTIHHFHPAWSFARIWSWPLFQVAATCETDPTEAGYMTVMSPTWKAFHLFKEDTVQERGGSGGNRTSVTVKRHILTSKRPPHVKSRLLKKASSFQTSVYHCST